MLEMMCRRGILMSQQDQDGRRDERRKNPLGTPSKKNNRIFHDIMQKGG